MRINLKKNELIEKLVNELPEEGDFHTALCVDYNNTSHLFVDNSEVFSMLPVTLASLIQVTDGTRVADGETKEVEGFVVGV